jgi:hypothetical protein
LGDIPINPGVTADEDAPLSILETTKMATIVVASQRINETITSPIALGMPARINE